jgi:hypothetical protein
MKILFIGSVKFSLSTLKLLLELKSNIYEKLPHGTAPTMRSWHDLV